MAVNGGGVRMSTEVLLDCAEDTSRGIPLPASVSTTSAEGWIPAGRTAARRAPAFSGAAS